MFSTTNQSLTSSMLGFMVDILYASSQGVVSHDKQQFGILWGYPLAHDLFKQVIPITGTDRSYSNLKPPLGQLCYSNNLIVANCIKAVTGATNWHTS